MQNELVRLNVNKRLQYARRQLLASHAFLVSVVLPLRFPVHGLQQ